MSNWRKYEFVCDPHTCDSLLELTVKDGDFKFPNGVAEITCPCGRQMQCTSANLIVQEQQKEEAPMETTEMGLASNETFYNPNALTVYKVIENGETTYPAIKTVDLEWQLHEKRRLTEKVNGLQSKINRIIDNMTEDYWYNPNTDISTVLEDLCEILEHNPVKNIDFTASVTIHGSIEIPIADAIDFDLDSYVFENLSIDTQTGSMDVHDFDVDRVYEN